MRAQNDNYHFCKVAGWILLMGIIIEGTNGCYGFDVYTKVSTLSALQYPAHTRPVEIYFGNSSPARPHVQLAMIEAVGENGTSTEELIEKLKNEAQRVGAHAVISIDKKYVDRSQGNLILDLLGLGSCVAETTTKHNHHNHHACDGTTSIQYEAPVLTGVAVRYVAQKQESVFVAPKKPIDAEVNVTVKVFRLDASTYVQSVMKTKRECVGIFSSKVNTIATIIPEQNRLNWYKVQGVGNSYVHWIDDQHLEFGSLGQMLTFKRDLAMEQKPSPLCPELHNCLHSSNQYFTEVKKLNKS